MGCPCQDESGQRGVLQPPDGGQRTEGIRGVGLVEREGSLNDQALVGVHVIVSAGAASGDQGHRCAGENRDEGAGRGGVADAHVAGDETARPCLDRLLGGLDAHLDGSSGLIPGHGGFDGEVAGAPGNFAIPNGGMLRIVGGDAHVGHEQSRPHLLRQDVDGRTAARDVDEHGGGDFLRPGRDTLGDHPVVTGEQPDDSRCGDGWRTLPGHRGQAIAHLLQETKAARWFGEFSLSRLGQRQRDR